MIDIDKKEIYNRTTTILTKISNDVGLRAQTKHVGVHVDNYVLETEKRKKNSIDQIRKDKVYFFSCALLNVLCILLKN